MIAELKELYSPDIDLANYYPDDPDNFGFLLQAMIGPVGDDTMDSFDIMVCTPDWLKSQYSKDKVLWGRHMMIVFEYDLEAITSLIEKYCTSCSGKEWSTVAEKLGRIGHWEYEDYRMP